MLAEFWIVSLLGRGLVVLRWWKRWRSGETGVAELTPRGSKGGNEKTREDYHGPSGLWCRLRVLLIESEVANGGEDQEAHTHPCAAGNQGVAPTEAFNEVKTWESADHVDSAEDYLSGVAIVQAGGNENGRFEGRSARQRIHWISKSGQPVQNEKVAYCHSRRRSWLLSIAGRLGARCPTLCGKTCAVR